MVGIAFFEVRCELWTCSNSRLWRWWAVWGSHELPKLFGRWERLAAPLGYLDPDSMELCHHDTHARNFLFRSKLDRVSGKNAFETPDGGLKPMVMIDWEFAGMSHPGFDLGNMLCTWTPRAEGPGWCRLCFAPHAPLLLLASRCYFLHTCATRRLQVRHSWTTMRTFSTCPMLANVQAMAVLWLTASLRL